MMAERKVAIHQPNFFPWLGYFYKIAKSDIFVFLDEVNYPKSGSSMSCFCNRTKLMNENELIYFSHSVERKSGHQPINTVIMSQHAVFEEKLKTILTLYKNAPFFYEIKGLLEDIYSLSCVNISTFNVNAIIKICEFLEIDTEFFLQSSFNLKTFSSELLRDLIRSVHGRSYIAGSGASQKYLDLNLFQKEEIKVEFILYPDFHYKHFNSGSCLEKLSIIDVLMNCGRNSTAAMLEA